jgi:hypothetical protein
MRLIARYLLAGYWAAVGGVLLVLGLPGIALADDYLKSCEEHPDGGWIDKIESSCKVAGPISGICVILFALFLLWGVIKLFSSLGGSGYSGRMEGTGNSERQVREDAARHEANTRYNRENFG